MFRMFFNSFFVVSDAYFSFSTDAIFLLPKRPALMTWLFKNWSLQMLTIVAGCVVHLQVVYHSLLALVHFALDARICRLCTEWKELAVRSTSSSGTQDIVLQSFLNYY